MKLRPYQKSWKSDFEQIEKDILSVAKELIKSIDHIGSTSITGMISKDIIDVQIGLNDFEEFENVKAALVSIGYTFVPEIRMDHAPGHKFEEFVPGFEKRFFKSDGNDRRAANIHVRLCTGKNFAYALKFRNFLRANKEAAYAYAQFKERLAGSIKEDINSYCLIKDPVCDLIMMLCESSTATQQ